MKNIKSYQIFEAKSSLPVLNSIKIDGVEFQTYVYVWNSESTVQFYVTLDECPVSKLTKVGIYYEGMEKEEKIDEITIYFVQKELSDRQMENLGISDCDQLSEKDVYELLASKIKFDFTKKNYTAKEIVKMAGRYENNYPMSIQTPVEISNKIETKKKEYNFNNEYNKLYYEMEKTWQTGIINEFKKHNVLLEITKKQTSDGSETFIIFNHELEGRLRNNKIFIEDVPMDTVESTLRYIAKYHPHAISQKLGKANKNTGIFDE